MNLNAGGWASPLLRLVARLRSDSLNSTTPVTEINGGTISAANADIALVAKGTGATLAQVPDGTTTNGAKRGAGAVDWQKLRNTGSRVASGAYATIAGGSYNGASGINSTVAGGENSIAAGSYSSIGGGQSNNASSDYSFVGGGQTNTADTSTHATVCGGNNNTASGQYSFVGGGQSNTATVNNSVIGGGGNNSANSQYSVIPGGRFGNTRGIQGYFAFPACNGPISAVNGISQGGLLVLGRATTDATATVLASNGSGVGTTNQVILPNNAAYYFRGSVIAGVTGAGNTKAWTFEGAIKRGTTAASTAIVGSVVLNVIAADAGASAWTVAITADTTNGGIAVTVTGAAATTIRWVAKIETTEMTY
jgi:hypothetical protein